MQPDRQQDETDHGDPAKVHFLPSPQQSQDRPRQQEGNGGQTGLTGQGADRLIPIEPC